eukprot:TRINITY_DN521_c0_g1_i1.p1 TRINITY_DN521_c0_g1~~TRINITY_DN521_c0_g1_i1.p1  ORF type:complete len:538 (-),score=129.85 TRINITY_DN521_c0_g1_i1:47-1660(-)
MATPEDIEEAKGLGFEESQLELLRDGGEGGNDFEGELQKRTKQMQMSVWKKRYIVVVDACLSYYASKTEAEKSGSSPEGFVMLEDVEEIKDDVAPTPRTSKKSMFSSKKKDTSVTADFEIVGLKRGLTFRCQDVEERQTWVAKLRELVDVAKKTAVEGDVLTQEQEMMLTQFRSRMVPQKGAPRRIFPETDVSIARFLRSAEFDLQNALLQWQENARWRDANNVGDLTIADVYAEAKRGYGFVPGCVDRKGRQVCFIKAGAYSNLPSANVRQVIKYLVYLRESDLDRSSRDLYVVDLAGVKPLSSTAMMMNKSSFYLNRYCYPDSCSLVLLINTPWFIRAGWNVVRSMVPPEQRRMYKFLGNNTSAMQDFIAKDQIPTDYGGTYQYDHDAWVEKRFEVDGVDKSAKSGEDEDPNFMVDVFPEVENLDVTPTTLVSTCTKGGWMTKQGGSVKSWKRRWCVLEGTTLYYFKTKKQPAPQGSISLKDTEVTTNSKYKCAFDIKTTRRTFPFKCESEEERDEWVKLCNDAVADTLTKELMG